MADARLGVEIDNSRIVEVTALSYGSAAGIDLSPIERGQRHAVVRLFVLRGSRSDELSRIDVRDLPRFSNRRALLRLRAAVDRNGELRLRLDVEGRLYHEERHDVRRYLRRRSGAVLAAAAVVLLLILGGALWWITQGLTGTGATSVSTADTAAEGTAPDGAAGDQEGAAEEQESAAEEQEGAAEEPAAPTGAEDEAAEDEAADGPAAGDDAAAAETREEGAEPEATEPEATEPEATEPEPAVPSPREWIVYFRPDSPELTEPTREELAGIAEELAAAEETADSNTDREVDIVGHTALAGTEQGRYGLSRERARNVYEYLLSEGWEPAGEVAVRGVGGEEPVTRDPDEQQRNRRVEISLRPR